MMADKSYIEKLEEENRHLKSLLQKRSFVYEGKHFVLESESKKNVNNEIKIEDDVHDINPLNIKEQFTKFFEDIDEVNLPAVDKLKLFPIYCKLFQTSFDLCRNAFTAKLTEPLYALTELTEEENRCSKSDFQRQKKLSDVTRAHRLLLNYSFPELRSIDYSVVEKIKVSIPVNFRQKISKMDELIIEVVKICWKMQMMPKLPMFICQPKAFNDKWHETFYDNWDNDSTNDLVYYRPVLMNSVGGTPAYKGLVGNGDSMEASKNEKVSYVGIIYHDCGNQKKKFLRHSFINGKIVKCNYCQKDAVLTGPVCIGSGLKFLHDECFSIIRSKE